MNGEMLVYVLFWIFVVSCLVLNWRRIRDRLLELSEADRRAKELLCSVLNSEQYDQLMQNGYLDIPSPRNPGCIYRLPRGPGLVRVIENGRQTAGLCLQPLEKVPDADMVVMHKLMIEADEETYLQTANRLAPLCISVWDD